MLLDYLTYAAPIASIFASLMVIVTIILTIRGLMEAIRSRSLNALQEVFQRLTLEEMSISRSYVINHDLPIPGMAPKDEKAYRHMHRVWVSFDNLGILIHNNMLPRDVALSMFYDAVIKCWKKLEPHIEYEEFERNAPYQIYFREFYGLSCQYALKLVNKKKKQFEKAKRQNKKGKARAIGIELQGMYQTLGQKSQLESITKEISDLKQTVFLDRDGTLNIDDYVTFRKEQFQLIPGVREGLLRLKMWGFDFVIVSNQGGIGKGDYTLQDMLNFNEILYAALDPVIINPDDFYHCPHHPDIEKCDCRKPEPGLFFKAQEKKSINLSESYMIGDKMSDILAAKQAGCKRTILVKTGITDDTDKYDVVPDYTVDNLIEAARVIAEVEGIE